MKKFTKKIMAIMLSLVMILGCIPSFTTVVEAATRNVYNKAPNEDKLINHGRLGLGRYTVITDNDGNWITNNPSDKNIVYITPYPSQGYKLKEIYVCPSGQTNRLTINLTPYGTDWKLDPAGMTGDVDIYATFERDIKTVADVLDTVEFPTSVTESAPIDAWVNSNGGKLFIYNNGLYCYNGSTTAKLTALDESVSATEGGYIFTDSNNSTFKFVMTGDNLTSIIINIDGPLIYSGTYEPTVKTITVNYEQPKTIEELEALNEDAITVDANATSISTFDKNIIPVPLYALAPDPDPDFLGYGLCITMLVFEEGKRETVDSVYLRDINLGKPEKTLFDILGEASTIDYAVTINNTQIWVIEKFDFSKKLNITASLNTNMKVEDAINSITDDLTDDGINRLYRITEDFDGDDLDNDTTLEAGKKYYLHGLIAKVKDSAYYNQVSINDEVLPNEVIGTEEDTFVTTIYDADELTNCGFEFHYEFTIASNSSSGSSKKYKASDSKDTAEKVSGSGKKGSKRIVTPQEGRKVESVIVTDKDGNRYEVTNEGDGTYSFIQPGTNVDVEVKYKNRLIELTIGSLDASVDDTHHNLDVVPKVVNDRTMLPIRFVAENLGAKVDWDEKDPDTVVITRGDTRIEITLGSDIAKVNGQEYKLDSVAFAENDRTYLPVRFVSEKLNAIVEWNEERPMEVKIYER